MFKIISDHQPMCSVFNKLQQHGESQAVQGLGVILPLQLLEVMEEVGCDQYEWSVHDNGRQGLTSKLNKKSMSDVTKVMGGSWVSYEAPQWWGLQFKSAEFTQLCQKVGLSWRGAVGITHSTTVQLPLCITWRHSGRCARTPISHLKRHWLRNHHPTFMLLHQVLYQEDDQREAAILDTQGGR